MLRFLVRYQVIIVLGVVALMSGILSIVREILLIYFPAQTQQRPLFWGCVRIAFILSALLALYGAYQRGEDLQRDLNAALDRSKPSFDGELSIVGAAPSGNKQEDAWVIMLAIVKNTGAPSIADQWSAVVHTKSGKVAKLHDVIIPNKTVGFHMPNGTEISLTTDQYLPQKAVAQSISTGGACTGFYWGVARGVTREEVLEKGSWVELIFHDVTGKEYTLKKEMDPAHRTEFIDPRTLQPKK
ncbi:MAG: hypothetical protein ACJ71U_14490 [Terriglobales bacterium]